MHQCINHINVPTHKVLILKNSIENTWKGYGETIREYCSPFLFDVYSWVSMGTPDIDLTPSELKAIEIHKYYLSEKEGREVSLEEAIADFLVYYGDEFLLNKHRDDIQQQHREIEKYKWIKSEKEGRDIGEERAAEEWVERYGSLWRAERESLERNGFIEIHTQVRKKEGININMVELADIARRNNADLYLHKDHMKHYNFILFGKKAYLDVKSILCPKFLDAVHGEHIEFIATGEGAHAALEAAEALIEKTNSY